MTIRHAAGRRGLIVLFGTIAALAGATPARGQRVTYNGAASYSGGSYIFDARSNSYTLSSGLRVTAGPVSVGVSLPFMMYNGGLVTTIATGMALPTGGAESGVVSGRGSGEVVGTRGRGSGSGPGSSGTMMDTTVAFVNDFQSTFGDPYFSAQGDLYSGFGFLRSFSVSASAKAPMADVETGVSSGAWDFGAGASAIVGVGRVMVLTDVAYWWLGDMADLVLEDALSYALGVSVPAFSGRGSVMGLLSGMSKTIDTMAAPLTAVGSVSRAVGERVFLTAGVGVGLTESAPDFYATLGWSVRLDRMDR